MNHKEMWKESFGDTDKYVDFYFKRKAAKSIVYSKYDGGRLASMAFFTPYRVVYRGEECVCPYIVGVATRPEYRRRGYMRMLLEQGLMDARLRGSRLAFLCPADEKIYEPLGFRGVQHRRHLEVEGHRTKWYGVASYSHLELKTKEATVKFANDTLAAGELDLYVKRSQEYYELLYKETKALGGKVIVLREGLEIRGVAAYIHEEDFYEVTEVICDPACGYKVLESVCAYFPEEDGKRVVFDDSFFLGEAAGEGIVQKCEEKPSIMLINLDGEDGPKEPAVYINDIT